MTALLVAVASFGCSSVGRAIVPCPLGYSDQEKEVLAVVPIGTRREDVLRRLGAAGIEGNFGISQRVYYCDLWNRRDGQRWQMNVALCFDEKGVFYKTQVGDSAFTAVRDSDAAKSPAGQQTAEQPMASPQSATAQQSGFESPYVPSLEH
jgi:hypothetical protein